MPAGAPPRAQAPVDADDGAVVPPTLTSRPPAIERADAAVSIAIEEIRKEMAVLRQQLDGAFDEVVGRIHRVEGQLGAVRNDTRAHVDALYATEIRSAEMIEVLLRLNTTVEDALASPNGVPEQPAPAPPVAVDLGPVDERLLRLGDGLGEQLIDNRLRIERGLDGLRDELMVLRDKPITVDTTALEDVAKRGALHNSADIANLRHSIEALAETVRIQDKGISELRTTLDWIKERLLLR